MLPIFLIAAAIVPGGFFLWRFRTGYRQWKDDRHSLDKVLIGLDRALHEVELIQSDRSDFFDDLESIRIRIIQYKNDIERRRAVAPIKVDGFAAMATEIDGVGTRLSSIEGLGKFGDEGAWGCPLASATLETMAECHVRR